MNCRPKAYESSALPLSYSGKLGSISIIIVLDVKVLLNKNIAEYNRIFIFNAVYSRIKVRYDWYYFYDLVFLLGNLTGMARGVLLLSLNLNLNFQGLRNLLSS